MKEKSPFALNGVGAFHQRHALQGDVRARMDVLKDLGVYWDRSDFWWNVLEPREGEFDWSFSDQLLDLYEEKDLQIFPILCYSSAWARGNGYAPANEMEWRQFANFTYEAVNRYKDRIKYWEIWNEPNILPFWRPEPKVENYVRLLKEAYVAAKRADPDCVIVGMCTAGFAPEYIERAYQLGAKDYFDVLSCHYYHTGAPEESIKRDLQNLRALMTRYGDGHKKVWITEMGVTSHPNRRHGVSEEQQASLLVRNHTTLHGSGFVERVFWFCLVDWTDNPEDERWDSYLGLVRHDRTEKPSYVAYKTLIAELQGAEYVGDPRIDPNVYTWLWQKGEELILVAYAKRGSVKMELPVAGSSLRRVEIDGRKRAIRASGKGVARCVIDETPTYFKGVDPCLVARACFAFDPDVIGTVPREEREIELVWRNPYPHKISGRLNVTFPEGWSVKSPKTITLPPNQEKRVAIILRTPEDDELGNYTLEASITFTKGLPEDSKSRLVALPLSTSVRVSVGQVSSLRIRPLVQGDTLTTRCEVASYLSEPQSSRSFEQKRTKAAKVSWFPFRFIK